MRCIFCQVVPAWQLVEFTRADVFLRCPKWCKVDFPVLGDRWIDQTEDGGWLGDVSLCRSPFLFARLAAGTHIFVALSDCLFGVVPGPVTVCFVPECFSGEGEHLVHVPDKLGLNIPHRDKDNLGQAMWDVSDESRQQAPSPVCSKG